jgi:hypothetical protein
MDRKPTITQAEPSDFVALIDELESFSGRRCRSPLREKCLAAFVASPAGLSRVAHRAKEEARNVWGLISWAIDHGEHLLARKAKPEIRGVGACFICGELAPNSLHRSGQWWCSEHEEQAA